MKFVCLIIGLLSGLVPSLAQIALPIEVVGNDGYTQEVRFALNDPAGADVLYLKAHRLAYRDASTYPERGAKGSVRLNGGPWVPLDDSTVTCDDPEAAYGCLSGAYHTVRLTLPLEGAVAGENTLAFRFNGTDGFTSGYRILELNLQRNGQNVLSASAFTLDDPAAWTPPRPGTDDVQAGKVLWEKALLLDAPGGPPIRATCADCHARDGRDLEYYAFSNHSIQERAKFHGLSQTEAEQIASYIRRVGAEQQVGRYGRPWNPPYQPGPGLDDRPVAQWAAGAGLPWVLDQDADMLPYLFPEGTSEEAIAHASSTRRTLNVREIPIALQLPDWQAWLPEVHPVDVWGDEFRDKLPYQTYVNTIAQLAEGGASAMRSDPGLIAEAALIQQTLDPFRQAVTTFVDQAGAQPCRNAAVHGSEGFSLLNRPAEVPPSDQWNDPDVCERPLRAINHWSAVKHWEVMQEFGLEDAPPDVYPYGEARGWPGSFRQVFELAPHRIGNDSYSFTHLGTAPGAYFNTAWYQLQVILNAGNRNPRSHRPPDWKYQINHLALAAAENQHPQPLRYVQTLIKMQQNLDMRPPEGAAAAEYFPFQEDRGPTLDGWWLTHVTPWLFVAASASFFVNEESRFAVWDQLEDVENGLTNKVRNALLEHWLDKTETYSVDQWPRGKGQNYVNPADYVPTPYTGGEQIANTARHADGVYRTLPYLQKAGARPDLIRRLQNWGKALWPAADWERAPHLYWLTDRPYLLKNRDTGQYLYDDGEVARYGADLSDNPIAHWQLEGYGYGFYQFKNRTTGDYLNIERLQDYAEATPGNPGWGSALWRLHPVDTSYVRLQCQWPDHPDHLHTENQRGYAERGPVSPERHSAHWELIPVDHLHPARPAQDDAEAANASSRQLAYPNPVRDIVTLETTGTHEDYALYDSFGRTVITGSFQPGDQRQPVSVATLTPGIYVVRVGRVQQKLIISR